MKKNYRAIWVLFIALVMSMILAASVAPVALARERPSQDPVTTSGLRNLLSGKLADELPLSEELATAMNATPRTSSSFTGNSNAGAVFSANSNFFPTEGDTFAVISTGNTSDIPGSPADSISTDFAPGGASGDEARLTLNFTVPPWAHFLSFDFTFLSEEYPEFVGSEYNDYFYAELNGTNIAFDTNGDIINVNNNFFDPTITPANSFNGSTPLLTTTAAVEPNSTITLEFIVGDAGDGIYDTAVFLDNFRFMETGENGTVSPVEVCKDLGEEFNLTIHVFNYEWGNQSITITNGVKTVGIRINNHQFTCDEVRDLLYSLDLTTFETLPEILVVDFSESVNLKLWRSLGDYISGSDPDLHVQNLHLITGNGDFERPEISCTEYEPGHIIVGDTLEYDFECSDERIIVGVTELVKMVQRYGTMLMDYDWIRINPDTDSLEVRYTAGTTTLLLVNLSQEIANSTGLFGHQLAAVDAVVAFGSPSVWEGENPTFSEIRLLNDSGNLAVAYGVDQLLLTFDNSLIFNSLPAGKFGESLEAGSGHYWWSEPAFKKVHFVNDSGNLAVIFGEGNLTITYDEDLIFNSLPDRKYGESLEAGGGHYWWSEPSFNEVHFMNDTTNGTIVVTFGTDNATNLTLIYDDSLIFSSLPAGDFRSTLEGPGGHYWWSEPAFHEVHFRNDTTNGTLVVTFGTDGAINLTLIYDGSLIFSSMSSDNFRSTLEGPGGHAWWSEPAFNEVQFRNDTANGTLAVYMGSRGSSFVPQLVIQYCAELFEGEYPVTLRRTLEWLGDNERFATLLERFDYVLIECLDGEGARVTLLNNGTEVASKTFDLQGVTDPEFAERVIAFFSEFLNPPQVPALNLLGILSLMGLLCLVAARRIRPRV
jgi:hypothetical protein